MLVPAGCPESLLPTEYLFALEYLANGFNATGAYRKAHPKANAKTCSSEGYKHLRKPEVKKWLAGRLLAHWRDVQMDGDEALGRVSQDARTDVRLLFEGRTFKAPEDWPAEIAGSVKGVQIAGSGKNLRVKVTLVDPLAARRIILEQTGKLKDKGADAVNALAEAIRGNLGLKPGDSYGTDTKE